MLLLEKFDAISVTNEKGEYIYANQNWLNTFHVTLDDLTNKHPWDLIPGTMIKQVIETKKAVIGHTLQNMEGFVSYYPIIQDNQLFGVLIWVFYTWMETALKFSQMVTRLSRELERTKASLNSMTSSSYSIRNLIGESPAIVQLRKEIEAASRTISTVLIEGETGVGKELIAHSIHDLSSRCESRFVRVNCAAIPRELAESELFGYEEGAFTGARRGGKIGKFELANGGGIFLDEINQLPVELQPKLLRVLQEREVERVGGKDVVSLDVRVIAATNVPLEELVQSGTFRKDLYYRLNVIKIRVPPLRERKEDIPLLTRNLVARLNHQLDLNISYVDDLVLQRFQEYDWPGNVRELQNALESAMNHAQDETLLLDDCKRQIQHHIARDIPEFSSRDVSVSFA
ncbi:MAG: sigma 54-interacting transcriptional regulator [Clostridiales bacterium]|nr:sigma 54-interacting transcriptional regulator [Clostridiales bacterium]